MSTCDRQASGLQIPRPPAAPWLAIAGAKGGVGKTVLATNLALLLRRAGHRTLLVDFDPGCGNVAVHLRLGARFDLEHVLAGRCDARDALVEGPAGLHLLLGRTASTTLAGGDPALLARAIAAIDEAAADHDVVICDTGAGLGAATLAAAERAQLVLSVTTTDPAALTDTYALAKVLHHRGRALPHLVVNRVQNRDEAMQAATRLNGVTRRFLAADTRLLGWLSQDPLIELSVRDQRPLALFGQGQGMEDLRGICAAALASLPPLARRNTSAPAPRTVRLRPALR